jgi:hypothetical protein
MTYHIQSEQDGEILELEIATGTPAAPVLGKSKAYRQSPVGSEYVRIGTGAIEAPGSRSFLVSNTGQLWVDATGRIWTALHL